MNCVFTNLDCGDRTTQASSVAFKCAPRMTLSKDAIQSLPCISPGGMNAVWCLLWIVFRGLLVQLLMYMKDFAVCEQLVINLEHRLVKGTDVEVQGNDLIILDQPGLTARTYIF